MPKLSQETLAVIGAGIALAALILTSTAGLRSEIQAVRTEVQAVRTEMRAEIRDVRAEARADREVLRAETRADREALRAETRADREAFERHIIRLTEQQSILGGNIESVRNRIAATQP